MNLKTDNVIVIPGGDTKEYQKKCKGINPEMFRYNLLGDLVNTLFKNRVKWILSLEKDLGEHFDVDILKMPYRHFADYDEWEQVFEESVKDIKEQIILIGFSLGSLFLIKYLSENTDLHKQVKHVFFVSTFFNCNGLGTPGKFNFQESDLSYLESLQDKMTFFHSKDDKVIPFKHFLLYKDTFPNAEYKSFKDRGHFNSHIKNKIPELIESILISSLS